MPISRRFALGIALCGLAFAGCPPIDGPDAGSGDGGAPATDAGLDPDGGAAPADSGTTPPPIGARVATESGDVIGELGTDQVVFRGIPYAAPPVGPRRWRAPESPLPFEGGERAATAFGPVCPQGEAGSREGDEDCLTLNVWSPRAAGSRPVMVFIHGGSFISGSGSYSFYDGTNLAAAGDVVVVTINYRLGALGFLATESLAAESGDGAVGNYGIRDQIAALQWVQRNIGAFGGDPDQVTVFGESAGSISICALLGAPEADGLYHRAILESGGGCIGFTGPREGAPSRVDQGAELITALGCAGAPDELACARAATSNAVLDAIVPPPTSLSLDLYASMQWGPTVDGSLLPEDPGARALRGADPDVPVIIGMNRDEAHLFTIGTPIHLFNYRQLVADFVGETHADAVVALYPIAEFGSARAAFNAAGTDLVLGCDIERFAAERTAAGHATHVYEFTQTLSGLGALLGSAHALELAYVFGNFLAYTPNAEDLAVSATMQRAWTQFAHTGAPELTPAWGPYVRGTPSAAVLDEPAVVSSSWRANKCDGLRAIGLLQ